MIYVTTLEHFEYLKRKNEIIFNILYKHILIKIYCSVYSKIIVETNEEKKKCQIIKRIYLYKNVFFNDCKYLIKGLDINKYLILIL